MFALDMSLFALLMEVCSRTWLRGGCMVVRRGCVDWWVFPLAMRERHPEADVGGVLARVVDQRAAHDCAHRDLLLSG